MKISPQNLQASLVSLSTLILISCSTTDLYQVDPISTHVQVKDDAVCKNSAGTGKSGEVNKPKLCYSETYQSERWDNIFLDKKRVIQYSDLIDYFNKKSEQKQISGTTGKPQNPDTKDVQKLTEQQARNAVVQELRSRSNEICDLHKAAILAHNAVFNISLGGLTTLLAGTASVVGSFQAPIFAAGAAGTNSLRSLVNDEVYARSVAGLIVRAIEKGRLQSWDALSAKLSKPYSEYDIYAAISDAEEFHQTCSFYVGITRISEALENQRGSLQSRKAALDAEEAAVVKNIKDEENETGSEAQAQLSQSRQRLSQIRMLKTQLLLEQTGAIVTPTPTPTPTGPQGSATK